LVPQGYQPSFFIYLDIDPSQIDVNIHPRKINIKFADKTAVWQIINAAVRETLAKNGAMPLIDFDAEDLVDIPVATSGVSYAEPRATTKDNYNPFAEGYAVEEKKTASGGGWSAIPSVSIGFDLGSDFDFVSSTDGADDDFDYLVSGDSEEQSLTFEEPTREVAQTISLCCGRYAVAMFATKMVMVDLVRARERMLYDHYASSLVSGQSVSQQLLFPEELELTEEEYDLIEEYAVDFASLGFDIKTKGGNTIEVFGLPADVHTEQLDRAIYDMLQSLKLPQSALELRRNALAESLAHSEAVGKISFTQEDAERYVTHILATAESYTPAGKRIVAPLSLTDIKKMFE
jgi:DNA mismatch repair protein MutL